MSEKPTGYQVGNVTFFSGWNTGYTLIDDPIRYGGDVTPQPVGAVTQFYPPRARPALGPARALARGAAAHISATAIHEAGHVIIALLVGRHVARVLVDPESPGYGSTHYHRASRPASLYNPGDGPGAGRAAWLATRQGVEEEIAIKLAGPLAEAKALGVKLRALGARRDLEGALECARYLERVSDGLRVYAKLENIDPSTVLSGICKRTRMWIAQKRVWSAICALARVLDKEHELDASSIHRIIGEATGRSSLSGFRI